MPSPTDGLTQTFQPGAARCIAFPSFFHIGGEIAALKADMHLTGKYASGAEIEAHEAVADRRADRPAAMAAVKRFKELNTRYLAARARYFAAVSAPAQQVAA